MGIHTLPQVDSPSDRVRALADYIWRSSDKPFNMANSITCAYGFACSLFGEYGEHNDHRATLASLLQIPYEEASALYNSTNLNRRETVVYLRELAERV